MCAKECFRYANFNGGEIVLDKDTWELEDVLWVGVRSVKWSETKCQRWVTRNPIEPAVYRICELSIINIYVTVSIFVNQPDFWQIRHFNSPNDKTRDKNYNLILQKIKKKANINDRAYVLILKFCFFVCRLFLFWRFFFVLFVDEFIIFVVFSRSW